MKDNQPQGIGFYNIKSGETHYAVLEPQIQAFINSSDMGVNASRGQDFGWRLHPQWVKRIKDFRRDESKMQLLASRSGGKEVTTSQVLYAIYGEELRAAAERAKENENPFEEEYLRNISSNSGGADNANETRTINSTDSATQSVQEEPTLSDSDRSVNSAQKPATPKKK